MKIALSEKNKSLEGSLELVRVHEKEKEKWNITWNDILTFLENNRYTAFTAQEIADNFEASYSDTLYLCKIMAKAQEITLLRAKKGFRANLYALCDSNL